MQRSLWKWNCVDSLSKTVQTYKIHFFPLIWRLSKHFHLWEGSFLKCFVWSTLSKFLFSNMGLYFQNLGVGQLKYVILGGQAFSNAGFERKCISILDISYNLRYLFKTGMKDVIAESWNAVQYPVMPLLYNTLFSSRENIIFIGGYLVIESRGPCAHNNNSILTCFRQV